MIDDQTTIDPSIHSVETFVHETEPQEDYLQPARPQMIDASEIKMEPDIALSQYHDVVDLTTQDKDFMPHNSQVSGLGEDHFFVCFTGHMQYRLYTNL